MATREEHARALAMERRLSGDEKTVSLTVKMPESVRAAIYDRAKAEGTSASQWARELLVSVLDRRAALDTWRAEQDAAYAAAERQQRYLLALGRAMRSAYVDGLDADVSGIGTADEACAEARRFCELVDAAGYGGRYSCDVVSGRSVEDGSEEVHVRFGWKKASDGAQKA